MDGPASTLQVLHADAHCVAVVKPAGLLSVPGRGPDKQDCLARRIRRHYADALVVHRLDMATSGVWLMARGSEMQRAFSLAFQRQEVHKQYVAVVQGRLDAPLKSDDGWGLIDLPIGANWADRPRRQVDAVGGKPSQTRWRVLGWNACANATRLLLEPLTGRTHQLRVHLAAIGHPILGDALYAGAAALDASPRLLLHASELRVAHPATGQLLTVADAPPF